MSEFELDERLERDTIPVASLDFCELLLLNDNRWPWLILVPRLENAVEWHELFSDQRQDLDLEISNVAAVLKAMTECEKINIASLGNMVRQLHIHIIARNAGDDNWPGPVWGFEDAVPYSEDGADQLIDVLRTHLGI